MRAPDFDRLPGVATRLENSPRLADLHSGPAFRLFGLNGRRDGDDREKRIAIGTKFSLSSLWQAVFRQVLTLAKKNFTPSGQVAANSIGARTPRASLT